MKSIKEKLEEYAKEQDLRMAYNGSCDNCQQGFVAGANYVLDEIEEFQKLFSTCMNAHANGYLKCVIERLKK